MTEPLRRDLDEATRELKAHMASWEYAFAHGAGPGSGRDHPRHAATRRRTEELHAKVRNLKARLAEHEL
jgi:hypothetical protein